MTIKLLMVSVGTFLFQSPVGSDFNIWTQIDKFGWPTVLSVLLLWFFWDRQKKADLERNALIQQSNLLTQQLIKEVRDGNSCKFEK